MEKLYLCTTIYIFRQFFILCASCHLTIAASSQPASFVRSIGERFSALAKKISDSRREEKKLDGRLLSTRSRSMRKVDWLLIDT
jgi:hypothetical protein